MKLEYFGTDLRNAGHYFWNVSEYGLSHSGRVFGSTPFDPEKLPEWNDKKYVVPVGYTQFFQKEGYSVYAIAGSVVDKRGGCKSVFFVNALITQEELIQLIEASPEASTIVDTLQAKYKPHQ